jgi:hypothetical protein
MTTVAFLCGVFVGAFLGILLAGMAAAAALDDSMAERWRERGAP